MAGINRNQLCSGNVRAEYALFVKTTKIIENATEPAIDNAPFLVTITKKKKTIAIAK